MATRRMAAKGAPGATSPPRRLMEEIIDCYVDWRLEADAVASAYAAWGGAAVGDNARCFTAYMAALDQEEAAARTYAAALAAGERWLRRG